MIAERRERNDGASPGGADTARTTTEEKVRFLASPSAYSAAPREVEVVETHMAWVFLAGERVYKMKKPVRYPLFDFQTLAGRRRDCQAELRLNRRLAPDVYLGLVPLTVEEEGRLALAGRGEVVDWLVEMRRLPRERMPDRMIVRGARSSRPTWRSWRAACPASTPRPNPPTSPPRTT